MSPQDLSAPPTNRPDGSLQLHASTVVLNNRAVAIVGPSGVGKSTFALALMSRGAQLLADDITWLSAQNNQLIAQCPPAIRDQIEARGVGLLKAPAAPPTLLSLVIDRGRAETDRLPPRRTVTLLGHDVPLFHTPASDHFADAVLHYINHGWAE